MKHLIRALVVVVVVLACSGCSTSSAGATASPSATSVAAVDPCLVGTWTTVALSENSPVNDESIAYSGGAGEVFTITAQGDMTIDTHAAQPVVFVSAGETFSATVTGTGQGTLKTTTAPEASHGTFTYAPSATDTMTTTSFDSGGGALGPPRPNSPFTAVYTCTPGRSFTFYKLVVGYMVDGSKVTLTAAGSTSSPMASPAPS
ncbi:MAG TPA: hypothetical protein VGM49_03795 [Candidatus Limnocylindrales bacterium]|jgi:hypothetical protein